MRADGKIRKWMFWLLAIAIASQFYVVQELIAAFAFFAIGFAALALVVVGLYMLQKAWEMTIAHVLDGKHAAVQGFKAEGSARAGIL